MKPVTKKEKEDYLGSMCAMKRKENQIVKSDIAREYEVPLSRVTKVTEELIEEGYLWKDGNRRLFLTLIGLSKGQEYLERKRCLTEFLRLVSGVDISLAEKNACAIEHVLDDKILMGIQMFMENRHTYSYTMQKNDLSFMFAEGKRKMPIAFYKKGISHPRILSKEYEQFRNMAEADISTESYLYLIPRDQKMMDKEMIYLYEGEWKLARKTEKGFGILTEALDCVLRRNDKISEGSLQLAVLDEPGQKVLEEQICVLVVSLI